MRSTTARRALMLTWLIASLGCQDALDTPSEAPPDRRASGLEGGGSGVGIWNPKDPGGFVHCMEQYWPCDSHCNPQTVDPGTTGFCCQGALRTTCYEAGIYAPGDKDGDGVIDPLDNCVFTHNPDQANNDGDTWGDVCDNCPYHTNQDQNDRPDYDRIGNVCDDDDDNDGILDTQDNCPSQANPGQEDSDGDGIGDVCDPDLDGDGIANAPDNCPHIPNPNQENSDTDRFGDVCDNCVSVSNPSQTDSNNNGVGDACEVSTRQSCDVMSFNATCSDAENDYSHVTSCVNALVPPAPSLKRAVSSAKRDMDRQHNAAPDVLLYEVDVDTQVTPNSRGHHTPGRMQVLPFGRSTNDARISIQQEGVAGLPLVLYRPEVVSYDDVLSATPATQQINLPTYVLQDARDGKTRLKYTTGGYQRPPAYQTSICDISGSGRAAGGDLTTNHNPRPCQYMSGAGTQAGDCYDVTLMASYESDDRHEANKMRWELRTSNVTLLVKNPKTAQASLSVYPRIAAGTTLPAESVYAGAIAPGTPDNWQAIMTSHCDNSASAPKWCDFLSGQSRNPDAMIFTRDCGATQPVICAPGSSPGGCAAAHLSQAWDGKSGQGKFMFEPATTSDGRMLVLNSGGTSLTYAISAPADACQASGFKLFKPISCLPADPQAQHYDIARSAPVVSGTTRAFRDSQGQPIMPGATFNGAYPWIDRDAKHLFFAQFNEPRDAWRASHQAPAQQPGKLAASRYVDQGVGKGIVALGAWTRGKMVVMDNMLNPTDFSGSSRDDAWVPQLGGFIPYVFELNLYQGAPLRLRPGSRTIFNSPEHHLNHLDAQAPYLPFDVVWRFGTNAETNAEVVFDDYMLDDAFVVAHMNSPHKRFGTDDYYPADGFAPTDVHKNMRSVNDSPSSLPGFKFKETPLLQNASTLPGSGALKPPATLRLLGGARVEPVALGGVLGKGVYLDGKNDHIDMGFQNTNHHEWLYTLWLDSRELVASKVRTVLFWPDGSWVGLSQQQLVAYNARAPVADRVRTLSLAGAGVQTHAYAHLSVKVYDHPSDDERRLQIYINGTQLGSALRWDRPSSNRTLNGFAMDLNYLGGWSWFVVGDPGPNFVSDGYGARLPFKGWIDELRVYAITAPHASHLEERVCNLALGTLTRSGQGPTTCEQLSLASYDVPSELPPQYAHDFDAWMTECAARVHKNRPGAGPVSCEREVAHLIHNLALTHNAPRPDLSQVPFCVSCHAPNHPIPGLQMGALTAGSVPRALDPRRQPMDWSAVLGGAGLTHPSTGQPVNMSGLSGQCASHSAFGTGLWALDCLMHTEGRLTP